MAISIQKSSNLTDRSFRQTDLHRPATGWGQQIT